MKTGLTKLLVFNPSHILLSIAICFSLTALSQKQNGVIWSNQIDTNRIKAHLNSISSDQMEGRETGKEGQKKAAIYLMQELVKLGIPPCNNGSYFQKFSIHKINPKQIKFKIDGRNLQLGEDFLHLHDLANGQFNAESFVCVEKIEDLQAAEKESEFVLLLSEKITKRELLDSIAINQIALLGYKGIVIRSGKEEKIERLSYRAHEELVGYEDKTIIPVLELKRSWVDNYLKNSSYKSAKSIIKAVKKQKKGVRLQATISIESELWSDAAIGENVLAFVPGKRKETVVLMAHYDHLGKDGTRIFNGADDNASGTSALLEILRLYQLAYKAGQQQERSLLVLFVSGEEKGLLGSRFYTDHPIFPIDSTYAALNIDMIGRVDHAHDSTVKYVYVIGSNFISQDLHQINENVNRDYVGLQLDYTYNQVNHPERLYFRSDHYNFAQRGIPSIFYFSGLHADYHQETDTAEKINYEKILYITKLVFLTSYELLNHVGPLR